MSSGNETTQPMPPVFQFNCNPESLLKTPVLPPAVKKRIKALKNIQLDCYKTGLDYHKELYEIECKYHALNIENYKKRAAIIKGEYEPTEEECDYPELDDEFQAKLCLENAPKIVDITEPPPKGIPEFWLQILKTNTVISDQIREVDEDALKYLEDIEVEQSPDKLAFTLKFYFGENEFFSNRVLTKHYEMKLEIDDKYPMNFEGPEICKCTGCTIDWKPGKDFTSKQVTSKQVNKKTGHSRQVTKTVQVESFFNTFFVNPPTVPEDPATEVADELKSELVADFQMGQYLRDAVVPNAVLYYTGERDDDDDVDFEDEGEEEEDEDDDDDDEIPPPRSNKKGRHTKADESKPLPNECKQQ